jgi:hypothetical protein
MSDNWWWEGDDTAALEDDITYSFSSGRDGKKQDPIGPKKLLLLFWICL